MSTETMAEQLTLLLAAAFGFLGAPWIACLLPAAVLSLLATERIRELSRRYALVGTARVFFVSIPAIAAHATLFAVVAFGIGRGVALLLAA